MFRYIPFIVLIICSAFGAWLDMINVLTLVGYEMASGPFLVGLAAIAMLLPHLLFGRLFAHVAKTTSFHWLMIWSLVGRAGCSLALVFVGDIYVLILVLLVRSFLFGFMQPALARYVSNMPKDVNIAALINLIVSSSKIVAPAIGGVFAVTVGEQGAFMTSAVLSLLGVITLFWVASEHRPNADPIDETEAKPGPSSLSFPVVFMMMAPVLFIDGMSNFFSNVIPYLFSEYLVSKFILSIALSVSALGNILAGLWLIRLRPQESYPTHAMAAAWLASSALFAVLLLVLMFTWSPPLLIPLVFFSLSFVKTFYDIRLSGFIFEQPENLAVELAAAKQSFMAFAGILMTLIGTLSMERSGAMPVLYAVLALSGLIWLLWYVGVLWRSDKPLLGIFSKA